MRLQSCAIRDQPVWVNDGHFESSGVSCHDGQVVVDLSPKNSCGDALVLVFNPVAQVLRGLVHGITRQTRRFFNDCDCLFELGVPIKVIET